MGCIRDVEFTYDDFTAKSWRGFDVRFKRYILWLYDMRSSCERPEGRALGFCRIRQLIHSPIGDLFLWFLFDLRLVMSNC